ncbi:MAG: serine/threonine-protein kinase [Planctomycetota bacterium]|nr:serine/threonine-protein kinase [Planctomycetota bacterium]
MKTPPPSSIKIPGYRIDQEVARGGMGRIYRAHQIAMDRTVAIKILSSEWTQDPEYRARFQREARMVARLSHPNLVRGIDVGESDGHGYLIMEFVEGESLKQVIDRQGVFPETEALEYTRQIALALEHAHQNGLIHRDIKPENVMLQPNGQIKLTDLGLARPNDPKDSGITLPGEGLGTPHYVSPEQARGRQDLDIRGDIYSLGATMFHLLTARTPFTGSSAAYILAQHLKQPVPDPRKINPDISKPTALLILRCMAKKPERRPDSPTQLLEELSRISQNNDRSQLPSHPSSQAITKNSLSRTLSPRTMPTRDRWGSAILGILLGLSLVYFLWRFLDSDDKSLPPSPPPLQSEKPVSPFNRLQPILTAHEFDKAARVVQSLSSHPDQRAQLEEIIKFFEYFYDQVDHNFPRVVEKTRFVEKTKIKFPDTSFPILRASRTDTRYQFRVRFRQKHQPTMGRILLWNLSDSDLMKCFDYNPGKSRNRYLVRGLFFYLRDPNRHSNLLKARKSFLRAPEHWMKTEYLKQIKIRLDQTSPPSDFPPSNFGR